MYASSLARTHNGVGQKAGAAPKAPPKPNVFSGVKNMAGFLAAVEKSKSVDATLALIEASLPSTPGSSPVALFVQYLASLPPPPAPPLPTAGAPQPKTVQDYFKALFSKLDCYKSLAPAVVARCLADTNSPLFNHLLAVDGLKPVEGLFDALGSIKSGVTDGISQLGLLIGSIGKKEYVTIFKLFDTPLINHFLHLSDGQPTLHVDLPVNEYRRLFDDLRDRKNADGTPVFTTPTLLRLYYAASSQNHDDICDKILDSLSSSISAESAKIIIGHVLPKIYDILKPKQVFSPKACIWLNRCYRVLGKDFYATLSDAIKGSSNPVEEACLDFAHKFFNSTVRNLSFSHPIELELANRMVSDVICQVMQSGDPNNPKNRNSDVSQAAYSLAERVLIYKLRQFHSDSGYDSSKMKTVCDGLDLTDAEIALIRAELMGFQRIISQNGTVVSSDQIFRHGNILGNLLNTARQNVYLRSRLYEVLDPHTLQNAPDAACALLIELSWIPDDLLNPSGNGSFSLPPGVDIKAINASIPTIIQHKYLLTEHNLDEITPIVSLPSDNVTDPFQSYAETVEKLLKSNDIQDALKTATISLDDVKSHISVLKNWSQKLYSEKMGPLVYLKALFSGSLDQDEISLFDRIGRDYSQASATYNVIYEAINQKILAQNTQLSTDITSLAPVLLSVIDNPFALLAGRESNRNYVAAFAELMKATVFLASGHPVSLENDIDRIDKLKDFLKKIPLIKIFSQQQADQTKNSLLLSQNNSESVVKSMTDLIALLNQNPTLTKATLGFDPHQMLPSLKTLRFYANLESLHNSQITAETRDKCIDQIQADVLDVQFDNSILNNLLHSTDFLNSIPASTLTELIPKLRSSTTRLDDTHMAKRFSNFLANLMEQNHSRVDRFATDDSEGDNYDDEAADAILKGL